MNYLENMPIFYENMDKTTKGEEMLISHLEVMKLRFLMISYFLLRVLIPKARYNGQTLKMLVRIKIPEMTSSIIASVPESMCVK